MMKNFKTILREEKIHQFYKLVGYFIIVLSLILVMIPFEDSSIRERLGILFILNLGFHMFYYGISIVPIKQLNWMKGGSKIPDQFSKSLMIMMSYVIIFICLFASFFIIYEVVSSDNYNKLSSLLIALGAILGALKLNLRLRKRE
ncbi:hypothetical protein [Lacinutrix sp. Bg11-31]|uniref:hypothetical protein n=1 Tax=Lacinutrix sp. Bg11-31 TaxID=2057808 RepID=UPI000C31AC30|nr:hypothetical protein [Lacinutrix sp. Bg11-31]AUC81292.1 hypothetical protein CW733_03740 [Lacinutrix sp. Bg11-31]